MPVVRRDLQQINYSLSDSRDSFFSSILFADQIREANRCLDLFERELENEQNILSANKDLSKLSAHEAALSGVAADHTTLAGRTDQLAQTKYGLAGRILELMTLRQAFDDLIERGQKLAGRDAITEAKKPARIEKLPGVAGTVAKAQEFYRSLRGDRSGT